MKRLIICIAILLISKSSVARNNLNVSNKTYIDTANYPISNFTAINWSNFLGQPILSKVYPGHRFRSHDILINYAKGVTFILSVHDFKFMNPHHGENWDPIFFCKEALSEIELWQNDSCYYKAPKDK